MHSREKYPSAVKSLNEERVVLRGKKFLTSAVVATCVVVGSGVAATSAQAISYSIPQGQELYAWDYYDNFLVNLNLNDGLAVKVDPNATAPSLAEVEGGGYDPITNSTWVLEPICQLSTVLPSGFATPQFSLGADYADCLAFLTNGDGTAFVSATKVSTSTTVVVEVNLNTNQVVSISELGPVAMIQITGMSRNSSGEVWVSSIGLDFDLVSRLNFVAPQVLSISNSTILPEEVWDIAFDADGILWLNAWPDDFQLKAIDLTSPDPLSTMFNAGAFNYPFAGGFGTDAMWFPNAYTYATRASGQSPSPSPAVPASGSLASTGFELGGYLMLTGGVVALGALGILLSRRMTK